MNQYAFILISWVLASECISNAEAVPCVPRDFGNGGTVCVCNATYCDSTPEHVVPETGTYVRYTSSKDGLRLNITAGVFSSESTPTDVILRLNTDITYQSIHGFGGAFTDAAGICIKSLSESTQKNLLRSYFGREGSNYNLGRVPIAGSDFSTRKYTYDDVEDDILLEKFNLVDEDLMYKIPFMQKALQMNPELKFLAASWTAPPWMKTNNDYVGFGFLREEYYQLYADYLLKFLDEYKDYGLEMWAISTGNEPSNGIIPITGFNSMGWTPSSVAKWVGNNLGPTIRKSEHKNTLILALDDQRFSLPWFVNDMFANELARNYTDGTAVHWYWDNLVPIWVIERTHHNFPDKFLIMTEASVGDKPWDTTKVILGSWARGEKYVVDIIENLNHWVTGWVDWNLALNKNGGPNWKKNYVDAAIIVNPENDEFFKQPLYYAIAHFSKFIPRDSVRIKVTQSRSSIKSVALKTPDNGTVVVLYNPMTKGLTVSIRDPNGGSINLQLPPQSVQTIVYK